MKRQCVLPGGIATQAMLFFMTVILLSSAFVQATKIRSIHGRIVQSRHPPASSGNPHHPRYVANTIRGGGGRAITQPESSFEVPVYPSTSFPRGAKWSLQKARPKKSLILLPVPQHRTAAAWILNLIELTHWAAIPMGFFAGLFIFENAPTLERVLDGDPSRVFVIVFGLLCQVFGVVISGGMKISFWISCARVCFVVVGVLCQVFGGGVYGGVRHLYEGWQVAPFRSPFQSDALDQQLPLEECNNAWLRSVSYHVHFTFQSLGLGLFTMGVFGFTTWTKALVGGSTAIALLGPKEPRLSSTRMVYGQQRPVLPLSRSLAKVFAINLVFNLVANMWLFAAVLDDKVPKLYGDVEILACFVSVVPTLLIAVAGLIEGWFADTTFNQWHHLIASVTTLSGLASTLMLYQRFISFLQQG